MLLHPIQVAEHLLTSVQAANISFCILLVGSWVNGLGAPMLKFDLFTGCSSQRWGMSSMGCCLPSAMCNCLLCHGHGLSGGSHPTHVACMC
jgi:hypothetical protein